MTEYDTFKQQFLKEKAEYADELTRFLLILSDSRNSPELPKEERLAFLTSELHSDHQTNSDLYVDDYFANLAGALILSGHAIADKITTERLEAIFRVNAIRANFPNLLEVLLPIRVVQPSLPDNPIIPLMPGELLDRV